MGLRSDFILGRSPAKTRPPVLLNLETVRHVKERRTRLFGPLTELNGARFRRLAAVPEVATG